MASKLHSKNKTHELFTSVSFIAGTASWFIALVIVLFILLSSLGEDDCGYGDEEVVVRGDQFSGRPCDEIYVVQEGETLNSISDKCGDPFIVEENPHIHDPDDVFPGLVIKITPSKTSKKAN
ncbi:hypothetical protein HS088_TW17G00532 [Tripterygium wilfordii]|uniref:LysM domain-containing protein n=1 Tax=Tripterygium wilfordii TaxID=458696 RepID=A0A7J7CFS0_TRIWF|nr:uncharacterized protein LOC119981615 [Tripterygium wilfordii]KAF5732998.1 hypothetical protein HS088_TW17G00532 [Tripterygium wilfordii]